MQKTILITGSTDGIGLETAKMLASMGHHILLHGRNPAKLEEAKTALSGLTDGGRIESYVADLSNMVDVEQLAKAVTKQHAKLDVLINNAGVFKTPAPITPDGRDVRFMVNTFAPYLLTQRLLPLLGRSGRIVNLSSAAQSPVNLEALAGHDRLPDDFDAYAQSKLALTMWSRAMALSLEDEGPIIIAVNPGSLLGTKMVKQGFGVDGKDIQIGADILTRLALADEFETASGKYFDNDSDQFASPHPDALNPEKSEGVVRTIKAVLAEITGTESDID
ncbi:SDR family NAD(P)-dependent oxidoreductase [Pseudomonadota bacterium]